MGSFRTIVGGRQSDRSPDAVYPRGIELLLKKAKADPEFCSEFVTNPIAAANGIELGLTPTESSILSSMPRAGLESAVAHTRIAESHVPMLKKARTAASLAFAVALMVGTPSAVAATGVQEQPYTVQDSPGIVAQRLEAIQAGLESYKEAHGEYPSTLQWITIANPLEGLVPQSYLFDAWYQRFHYEGVLAGGSVIDYRLESVGPDLESADDNLLCPVEPERHAFVIPNPITITSPQTGETFPGEEGDSVTIVAAATHRTEDAEVSWILDRALVETTNANHELTLSVGPGVHELVAQDGNGNSDVVVFEVAAAAEGSEE